MNNNQYLDAEPKAKNKKRTLNRPQSGMIQPNIIEIEEVDSEDGIQAIKS